MFPIRDSHQTRIRPWVTLLLIGVSLFVFFGVQAGSTDVEQAEFLYRQAAISCEIVTGQPLTLEEINGGPCSSGADIPVFGEKSPYLAILISIFLHGGVAHVVFNMWFLWIFGNNVEEAFGHFGYLVFYLVGGIAATLVFVGMNPDSVVPLVGASGAIAAVLGSYAVLFSDPSGDQPRGLVPPACSRVALLGYLVHCPVRVGRHQRRLGGTRRRFCVRPPRHAAASRQALAAGSLTQLAM